MTDTHVIDTSKVNTSSDEFIQEFFGVKELRWFQIAARNQCIKYVEAGAKRIMIVQPTQTGKTVTIACSLTHPDMRKALGVSCNRPLRVLFVAHTHRLLTQADQTFADENNVHLIPQSMMSDIPQSVLDEGWDVTVLDECHHEACSSFQYHLEQLGNKVVIGLTATPTRADGCVIKFDHIIDIISREQAVLEGILAPTHIHTFVDSPAKSKVDVITDIVENYGSQMGQTMMFVKSIREVKELTKIIRELGYITIGLTGQSQRELDVLLNKFSEGMIQFVISCDKVGEGVDVSGCDTVFLGRTFGSYTMLNQRIGRASKSDSECHVWELVNPLSGTNLDTTVIVGTPESHRLVSKEGGKWVERHFDYVTHQTNKQLGMASGVRITH